MPVLLFLALRRVGFDSVRSGTGISRWIQGLFPDKKILIIQTHGDPKQKIHALRESLGDIFKSPFRSRIFVDLDSTHNTGDVDALTKMGVLSDNIVIWDKNGIEFVYPPPVVAQIFGCSESQIDRLILRDDVIELNGVQRKKSELCDDVVRNMSAETTIPAELERKLIKPLTTAIS